MAADFEKQSYWHDRFTSETSFEWLLSSHDFMSIISPHLPPHLGPDSRILHIGSGTSALQNHFRARGILNVTNIDYEPLAAERGRALEREAFGDVKMTYDVADATNLQPRERYDLVVDKSTVDAIACGGDDAVRSMARSVASCLAEGGVWISLSFSAYRFDLPDLPLDVQTVTHVPTQKRHENDPDIFHYCYRLRAR